MSSFLIALIAASMKKDIEMLPHGDLTVIGDKGINLSGGQKVTYCYTPSILPLIY